MSFSTLISGTQKKARSSVNSRPKNDESNDGNKFTIKFSKIRIWFNLIYYLKIQKIKRYF